MTDATFRWTALGLLAVIACSLYVLSVMAVAETSQRLKLARAERVRKSEKDD